MNSQHAACVGDHRGSWLINTLKHSWKHDTQSTYTQTAQSQVNEHELCPGGQVSVMRSNDYDDYVCVDDSATMMAHVRLHDGQRRRQQAGRAVFAVITSLV